MGFIEEFIRLMRKGPEVASTLDTIKLNTKSVVRGANEATFQFPCLMVNTIPIDMGNTIVRTLDRRYAAFTQTWISLHPFMDISLDPTPISYLKRLHQNLKLEHADDIEVSMMENTYNGEPLLYLTRNRKYGILIEGVNGNLPILNESNLEQLRPYLSDFNLQPITEADNGTTSAADFARTVMAANKERRESEKYSNQMRYTDREGAPKMVDRDVRKTNDTVPFGIQVKLIAKNEKNEFVQNFHIVVGVKAILHPIDSDEMIENIQRAVKNKSAFFKFLRWTTGEISLVRNIILDLDNIRDDAISRDNNRSPYFTALKRLREKKFGVRNFTVPHAIIPNATIVISSYEADYLLQNYGLDVKNSVIAKKIMSSLFLVCFVIVDEGTGTIEIFDDGSDSYQTYALETLERENMMTSNKLGREIGRMISQ